MEGRCFAAILKSHYGGGGHFGLGIKHVLCWAWKPIHVRPSKTKPPRIVKMLSVQHWPSLQESVLLRQFVRVWVWAIISSQEVLPFSHLFLCPSAL